MCNDIIRCRFLFLINMQDVKQKVQTLWKHLPGTFFSESHVFSTYSLTDSSSFQDSELCISDTASSYADSVLASVSYAFQPTNADAMHYMRARYMSQFLTKCYRKRTIVITVVHKKLDPWSRWNLLHDWGSWCGHNQPTNELCMWHKAEKNTACNTHIDNQAVLLRLLMSRRLQACIRWNLHSMTRQSVKNTDTKL